MLKKVFRPKRLQVMIINCLQVKTVRNGSRRESLHYYNRLLTLSSARETGCSGFGLSENLLCVGDCVSEREEGRPRITHTLLKSVLAMTRKMPACSALVIQAFWPFNTQCSPSLFALVFRAKASAPQEGSDRQ